STAATAATRPSRDRRLVLDAYALTASSVGNALTGLLCYVISARLFPQHVVGQAAGLTSGLVLLSAIASLDLHTALQRFLPAAGASGGRLVRGCYITVAAASMVAGVPFVILFGTDLFGGHPGQGLLWYPAAVALWSVFALQDVVLLGMGAAMLVPVENLVFGLLRLALLVCFVGGGAFAVFASWLLPVILLVVVMNIIVWRRVLPRFAAASPPGPPGWDARTITRFVSGSHLGNLVGVASANLLPLLVVARLGTEGNAVFFIAWTIPYSLRMISFNFGASLLVHGSMEPGQIPSLLRTMLRRQATLVAPVLVILMLFAHPVLAVFGPSYTCAANLLRLLALSLVPMAAMSAYLPIARVKGRWIEAVAISAAGGVAELGVSWFGLVHHGLTGLGLGFLAADGAVALAVLPRLLPFLIPSTRTRRERRSTMDPDTERTVGLRPQAPGRPGRGEAVGERTRAVVDAALLALLVLLVGVVLIAPHSALRPLVAIACFSLVPGWAVLTRLAPLDPLTTLGLAVAFSLAAELLVSVVPVFLGAWHAAVPALVLGLPGAALIGLDLFRRCGPFRPIRSTGKDTA
ncbi:lipopolysaccharide biosynthesis protein, partial [Frankia tisae]